MPPRPATLARIARVQQQSARQRAIAEQERTILFLRDHIRVCLERQVRAETRLAELVAEEDDRMDVEDLAGSPVRVSGDEP